MTTSREIRFAQQRRARLRRGRQRAQLLAVVFAVAFVVGVFAGFATPGA